jgi:hypothetical protein
MKMFFPLIFCINGLIFLLIGTIFYPPISQWLINMQGSVPDFWNLPLILGIVRIIFIIVGGFLFAFGIGLLIFKLRRRS